LKQRPVHIFYGDSNSCKSYLAVLTGKTIYETDSVTKMEDVPECLTQDIIVIGNRWLCDIEEIKNRLYGVPMIIEVDFKCCK